MAINLSNPYTFTPAQEAEVSKAIQKVWAGRNFGELPRRGQLCYAGQTPSGGRFRIRFAAYKSIKTGAVGPILDGGIGP